MVWISGLGIIPKTERSPVRFPVRAHARVVGQVPGWGHARGNQQMFLSHIVFLSLSACLSLSLKINKILKKQTRLLREIADPGIGAIKEQEEFETSKG